MPLRWSSTVRRRTKSIAILNSTDSDDMTHPCGTPVLTSKLRSPWGVFHSNAPVTGNPHPPPHPEETWGISQLKGKKEEKAPPYGGEIFSLSPN